MRYFFKLIYGSTYTYRWQHFIINYTLKLKLELEKVHMNRNFFDYMVQENLPLNYKFDSITMHIIINCSLSDIVHSKAHN